VEGGGKAFLYTNMLHRHKIIIDRKYLISKDLKSISIVLERLG